MAWTSPRTWVSGETVTAALLNTHVRDQFDAIGDPWNTYSPSWTATTTNPSIGNGTISGRYVELGQLVIFSITLTAGSTTSFGSGTWALTLPATTVELPRVFQGIADDISAGLYPILGVVQSSGTTIDVRRDPSTAGSNMQAVNASQPFAWASGDRLNISGIYETA